MTPDFRALCAELLVAIQLYTGLNPAASEMSSVEITEKLMDAMAATAAALATPPPEAPTDEERLADFTKWLAREMPPNTIIGDPLWWAPRIWRAVLERWGQ